MKRDLQLAELDGIQIDLKILPLGRTLQREEAIYESLKLFVHSLLPISIPQSVFSSKTSIFCQKPIIFPKMYQK